MGIAGQKERRRIVPVAVNSPSGYDLETEPVRSPTEQSVVSALLVRVSRAPTGVRPCASTTSLSTGYRSTAENASTVSLAGTRSSSRSRTDPPRDAVRTSDRTTSRRVNQESDAGRRPANETGERGEFARLPHQETEEQPTRDVRKSTPRGGMKRTNSRSIENTVEGVRLIE